MNSWYLLAKQDKRYKYNHKILFHKSVTYSNLKEAMKEKNIIQPKFKKEIVILKRTCEKIKI